MTNNDASPQVLPVTLADISELRAQRLTIDSESDLEAFTAEGQRISNGLQSRESESHLSVVGAVALAAVVIALAAIVALLLFGAGAALLGSLSDGS